MAVEGQARALVQGTRVAVEQVESLRAGLKSVVAVQEAGRRVEAERVEIAPGRRGIGWLT